MTTNPTLTLGPIAFRRRTLVRIMNRRRAELMTAYEKFQQGNAHERDLVAALAALYDITRELDRLDDADAAAGS